MFERELAERGAGGREAGAERRTGVTKIDLSAERKMGRSRSGRDSRRRREVCLSHSFLGSTP